LPSSPLPWEISILIQSICNSCVVFAIAANNFQKIRNYQIFQY
jgi:hypothetical protein